MNSRVLSIIVFIKIRSNKSIYRAAFCNYTVRLPFFDLYNSIKISVFQVMLIFEKYKKTTLEFPDYYFL